MLSASALSRPERRAIIKWRMLATLLISHSASARFTPIVGLDFHTDTHGKITPFFHKPFDIEQGIFFALRDVVVTRWEIGNTTD
uniref:Putative secreted protein n=1 Tax=Anopheles marajoara TaxID=58244 RepID=A0A2M4CAY6_9DIPT